MLSGSGRGWGWTCARLCSLAFVVCLGDCRSSSAKAGMGGTGGGDAMRFGLAGGDRYGTAWLRERWERRVDDVEEEEEDAVERGEDGRDG